MLPRKFVGVSQLVVWVALLAFAVHGAAADRGAVSVTTDAPSYAPGDPITVTLVNGTTKPIAPMGGIVCQGSPWPFSLQRLDDVGNWQDVALSRIPPCIGIAVALIGPGESQTKQVPASSDPGTYRVVKAYNPTDGSGQGLAASDPYDVVDPASMAQTDGTGSVSPAPIGYLEGQVSIGPLQPVQRAGVSPPTPTPETCTARGLIVYDVTTGAEAARFPLAPDCSYQAALAPGCYRVELDRRGIDFSRELPRTVQVSAGQSTRLDLSIDTGIR